MPRKRRIYLIIIFLLCIIIAESQSERSLHESRTIYSANEIKEAIEAGRDFACIGATIIGDLELPDQYPSTGNESPKNVNSSIRIIDSEVRGNIYFGNAFFKKSLNFDRTTFSGLHVNFRNSDFADDIGFSGAKFKCTADFGGAKVDGSMTFVKTSWSETTNFDDIICKEYASFRDNDFLGVLSFRNAHIIGPADFEESRFDKETYFSNSVFDKDVHFLAARFSDLTDFKGARFGDTAIFTRSRFDEGADFSDSQFMRSASFFYARFAGLAKFLNAKFDGNIDFRNCGFDGLAEFSSSSFLGEAKFEAVQFNKVVNFNNSDFTNNISFHEAYFNRDAYFQGAGFASSINLTDTEFNRLELPWDAIAGHIIYNNKTQLNLINNYKNMGWIRDYKKCYYDYRDKERISETSPLPRFMDTIALIYWDYGTNLYKPIAFIFLFASIFALVYYCLVLFKWAKVVRKSSQSGSDRCPWAKAEESLEMANSILSPRDALKFSGRVLLLMEKPNEFEIEYTYIGIIIWIERAVFGFLAASYVNSLLGELQSYFKPL